MEKQTGCRRLDHERVFFSWDRSKCHDHTYLVEKALDRDEDSEGATASPQHLPTLGSGVEEQVHTPSRSPPSEGLESRGKGCSKFSARKLIAIAICVFIRGPKIYRPGFLVEEKLSRVSQVKCSLAGLKASSSNFKASIRKCVALKVSQWSRAAKQTSPG